MRISSSIPVPCRSHNSASFGGDGGRLCVMGGGYTNAAELGRERRSCFYSCSSCCQFEKGAWKQHGQLELQSKWIDVCLSRVNYLRDFYYFAKDAIVNPPVFVSAENFAKVRASDFRISFFSEQRGVEKLFNSFKNIRVKSVGIIRIKVARNIIAGFLKGFYGIVRPLKSHIATLSRDFPPVRLLPTLRRFARLPIMRLTCSCDLTSPRCDWPSLMRNPSYVSASCSFWQMASQSVAFRKTEVARPFCVSMMGRCVSAVRATQSASVVRNSLIEIISSDGLKSNMAFSPRNLMFNIVRNCVRRVKVGLVVKESSEIIEGKQQGQLETTTFRGVRANSPAHRRNAERKGGVSVLVSGLNINHGLSRTRLTNARFKLRRSCFYSCSSRFEFSNLLKGTK